MIEIDRNESPVESELGQFKESVAIGCGVLRLEILRLHHSELDRDHHRDLVVIDTNPFPTTSGVRWVEIR